MPKEKDGHLTLLDHLTARLFEGAINPEDSREDPAAHYATQRAHDDDSEA